jgi:RNA polymerase sigma factor (sigma-70 family)
MVRDRIRGGDDGEDDVSRDGAAMLDRLVAERYGGLLAYATVLTGDRHEAQDVLHDALVSTFSARASFGSVPQAEAYVRRAVASRFVDRARRRTRERAAVARLAGREAVSTELQSDLLDADVAAALAALPPQQRACVVLRHLDDLSVRDTARLLGIGEGTVKRYVSDAVAALDAALGTTTTGGERLPVTLVDSTRDTPEVRRER